MQNKLLRFIREQNLISPGERLVCAVSGGADSVAMLFAFYLLRDKLKITLEAAHFNHHLRGEESQRDADFVRAFCDHPVSEDGRRRDGHRLPQPQQV